MNQIRLFVDSPLDTDAEVRIGCLQAHYLQHVMRIGCGSELIIFNGCGGEYEAEVTRTGKGEITCRVGSFLDVDRELYPAVHIVQAACRNEKIETVLQRGTELGAASFQIVCSSRSDLRLDKGRRQSRLARWQKILVEATEQSGRTLVPGIQWCKTPAAIEVRTPAYCLHPESTLPWAEIRKQICLTPQLTFAIGPEGGWDKTDLGILKQKGFLTLCFGPRVMRTQTAAPAMLSAVQAVLT